MGLDQVGVEVFIVLGLARHGEPLLKVGANLAAVQPLDQPNRCHRRLDRIDQHTIDAVLNDLRCGAFRPGNHRGATGIGLDHHQAEGFGPVDREEQGQGMGQ